QGGVLRRQALAEGLADQLALPRRQVQERTVAIHILPLRLGVVHLAVGDAIARPLAFILLLRRAGLLALSLALTWPLGLPLTLGLGQRRLGGLVGLLRLGGRLRRLHQRLLRLG